MAKKQIPFLKDTMTKILLGSAAYSALLKNELCVHGLNEAHT